MKQFEIWDVETNNILGAWESETKALEVVREVVRSSGEAAVLDLVLLLESDEGDARMIAEGSDLLTLSRSHLKAAPL